MGQSCEAMRYEDVLVISCAESSSAMNLNDSTPAHGRHARYPNDEQWTSEFALNPSVTWSMHEPMCGTPELGSHSSDLHLNGLGKATVRREDLLVDDSRLFCDDSVLPSGLPTAVKAWTVPQHEVKMRSLKVVGWFTVIALRFHLKPSKRRSYELDRGVAEDSIQLMDSDLPRSLGPSVSALSVRIRALCGTLLRTLNSGIVKVCILLPLFFRRRQVARMRPTCAFIGSWDVHVASGRQVSRCFRWVLRNSKSWQRSGLGMGTCLRTT